MKQIPVSNKENVFTLVDDDDYEYLSNFIWTLTPSGYVVRSKRRRESNCKNLAMHRMVIECPEGLTVDHINFNKLDNRKGNLRILTRSQNSAHQPPNKKYNHSPKPKKLYPFYKMLTKCEIKAVKEFLKSLNIKQLKEASHETPKP